MLGFGYLYLNEGGSRLALKTSVGTKWEYYVLLEPDSFRLKRVKKGGGHWTPLLDVPEGSTKSGMKRWSAMSKDRIVPRNVAAQFTKIDKYLNSLKENEDDVS